MRWSEGSSKYLPIPFSYYITDIEKDATIKILADSYPFARKHKDTGKWEVTREVLGKVCRVEPSLREKGTLPYSLNQQDFFTLKSNVEYGYQQDAVDYAKDHLNVLINFSQGMGKTLTTLRILNEHNSKRNLIITGVANLQEEWLKDSKKHFTIDNVSYATKLNISIVGDTPDSSLNKRIQWLKKKRDENSKDTFTHLIGVESLRNTFVLDVLNEIGYTSIVIDECQSAKGMKAEQTKGLHDLNHYEGQRRIALSGTPVINDPLEYYSVLRFLRVLYYRNSKDQCSKTTFNTYYGEWDYDYLGHWTCGGYKNLEDLKMLISPVLLYAPKELLNLKPKDRKGVKVECPSEVEELVALYKRGAKKVKKEGYSSLTALRAEIQRLTSSAEGKIEFIAGKGRSLVFSNCVQALEKVKVGLEKRGKKVLLYHGRLKMPERLSILEKWKEGEEYDVLLLSTNAARYGLNLQEVNTVIFLEPPTSYAILEQAEDRSHRIGQTETVISYLLIAGEGDEEALKKMYSKQKAINELMGQ